jgi:hypothetical protein
MTRLSAMRGCDLAHEAESLPALTLKFILLTCLDIAIQLDKSTSTLGICSVLSRGIRAKAVTLLTSTVAMVCKMFPFMTPDALPNDIRQTRIKETDLGNTLAANNRRRLPLRLLLGFCPGAYSFRIR